MPGGLCCMAAWLPRMHADLVHCNIHELETMLRLNVAQVSASCSTYKQFKRCIVAALLQLDIQRTCSRGKNTVNRYVQILGSPESHPAKLQHYLAGVMTGGARAMLVCRASALRTGRLMHRMHQSHTAACPHCNNPSDSMEHALLQCSASQHARQTLWHELTALVCTARVAQLHALPLQQQLHALLGDSFWGCMSQDVWVVIQQYVYLVTSMRAVAASRRGSVTPVGNHDSRGGCHVPALSQEEWGRDNAPV